MSDRNKRTVLTTRASWNRALLIAALVGTVLVVINHGDHLLRRSLCDHCAAKMSLSYVVPFLVSLFSASLASRDRSG